MCTTSMTIFSSFIKLTAHHLCRQGTVRGGMGGLLASERRQVMGVRSRRGPACVAACRHVPYTSSNEADVIQPPESFHTMIQIAY